MQYSKDTAKRFCAPKNISKPKEETVAFLKHNDILRNIFPINKSGSKQIIVGMDPALEFQTLLTIGRPGWSGVRLDGSAWDTLLQLEEHITKFFGGHHDASIFEQESFLNPEVKIKYQLSYGKSVVCFISTKEGGQFVTLAQSSWEGLLNVKNCVNHHVEFLNNHANEVYEFVMHFAKSLKELVPSEILHGSIPHANSLQQFEKYVKEFNFNSLLYTPFQQTMFDYKKLFCELQSFCVLDLGGIVSTM